jgi:hypothetical protein
MTKRQRKLLKGGNAMVKYSLERGLKIGEYFGSYPMFHNIAKIGQPANFAKVKNGLPFVRKENHIR